MVRTTVLFLGETGVALMVANPATTNIIVHINLVAIVNTAME